MNAFIMRPHQLNCAIFADGMHHYHDTIPPLMDTARASVTPKSKRPSHHVWCCVAILITFIFGSSAHSETSANNDQSSGLIETLIALPINSKQLDPSFIRDYDSPLVAASLLERNRRFQQRWMNQTTPETNFPTDK